MIETLRTMVLDAPGFYIGWGGLSIGLVFGFTLHRTQFCAMGAVSDFMTFGSFTRFRAWLLSAAVAILGVAALEGLGVLDTSYSIYTGSTLPWGGHILGGVMFGLGMVFAGGCVSRNVARAGGGDLRALMVVIVIGIAGYMTIGGLFAPARVALTRPLTADLTALGVESQRMDALLAHGTGMDAGLAQALVMAVLAGGILIYAFASAAFRRSTKDVLAGLVVGLCVVAGWLLTGLAFDEFADRPAVASLSLVRPAGDLVYYLMRFTALGAPSFTIVTILGTLLGAFVSAVTSGRFALASFASPQDTVRSLAGAVLMGVGGVMALGCTIGQSVTGLSTLGLGSLITMVAIVLGAMAGVKTLEAFA